MEHRTPDTVVWAISNLKEHPRQAAMFGDTSPLELEELAKDIEANGLREPPTILPDGTLVTGHRRVNACRLLGWADIPVVVEHDLAAQGPDAVEQRLIEDNLHRRQLDELSIARCCRRLMELERKAPSGRLSERQKGELRDRIGQRFGLSGRTVDRYLQLLRTPVEVQHAVSTHQLPLTTALRIASLGTGKQEQIAAAIRAGGNPLEVVAQHLPSKSRRHRHAGDAGAAFIRGLARGLDDLDGRLDQVRWLKDGEVATLERAHGVIARLLELAREARAKAEEEDPMEDLFRFLDQDDPGHGDEELDVDDEDR